MKDFLDSSSVVNKKIRHLSEYTDELKKYMLLRQSSVLGEQEDAVLAHKIDTVVRLFTELSYEIRGTVRKNQRETMQMKHDRAPDGVINMRELHTFRHGKDLADAVRRFQDLQCEYKEREGERFRDIARAANPGMSEEEVRALAELEDEDAILASSFSLGSKEAQGVYNEAKRRRATIKRIAEKIEALKQIIEDIDLLVKKGTPVVDTIVTNMATSEEHTSKANVHLDSALRTTARWGRIKRFLAFVCLLILLLLGIRHAWKARKSEKKSQ